jgi:hypothetical protein
MGPFGKISTLILKHKTDDKKAKRSGNPEIDKGSQNVALYHSQYGYFRTIRSILNL